MCVCFLTSVVYLLFFGSVLYPNIAIDLMPFLMD